MALVNKTNLDVVNTSLYAAVNGVFENPLPGSYSLYSDVFNAEGDSYDIVVVDGLPTLREWTGAKQYQDAQAYRKNIPLKKYEATFELQRTTVEYDKSGVVGRRINAFAKNLERSYDKICMDFLIANATTGYDGSNLLADAHAVGSSTFDNLTTAAISNAEILTAQQYFESLTDIAGEPLGMYPTHIVCGHRQRRIAMELTGSTRLTAINTSGAQDATSSVVAIGAYENYIGGSLQVVVSPRITGNQWFMMDLSKPGLRPVAFGIFRQAQVIAVTDMASASRFENDVYKWSLELDAAPGPAAWQTIYGSVTA